MKNSNRSLKKKWKEEEIKVKFYDGNKKVTKLALLLDANEEGIFLKEENDLFINFDKIIVARLEPIFEVSNE